MKNINNSTDDTKTTSTHIALFKGKQIRKTIYNNEWWFSVVDVVQVLTDQPDDYMARKYWNKLAQRLRDEGSEVVTKCHHLKLEAPDGKMRETDCANTEGTKLKQITDLFFNSDLNPTLAGKGLVKKREILLPINRAQNDNDKLKTKSKTIKII
ncbi:MAG: hypothetical protein WC614_05145 [bacterium]